MINISIDVTKIPKDKLIAGKNGAKYLNITVDKLKETDRFGNTHSVYLSQSKEERTAKANKIYLGNGKEFIFNNTGQNTQQQSTGTVAPQNNDADSLHF